jgi:trimeric autotransporter adhesin
LTIHMKTILSFLLTAASAVAQQYVISTVAGGPAIPTPIVAASASIGEPSWVAVGPTGDVYFTDGGATVYKIDARGVLTRVAGNGRPGDGGPAASAPLGSLNGVAVDTAGNLYLADATYHRILKVATNGFTTTVTGNGSPGFSGDNGPAANAQLANPMGVAVDAAGNLYIADGDNYRVRKVATNGIITTVAGNGSPGYSGDGGPAPGAQLSNISGVALDASGNLYIADYGNNRIRKVAPNGVITTAAGNGSSGSMGDGGPAANAQLASPLGVVLDFAGNLYIADSNNNRVRKVSTSGIIASVAGNGARSYSGDGPAATAPLNNPTGMAVDPAGNLYLADAFNYRIRKITPSGSIVSIAGNGSRGYLVDGGSAAGAQLDQPRGMAMDTAGNLYIADGNNCRIRRIATNGIITTVAGNGSPGYSGDNGPAASAQLAYQLSVAVSAAGDLYIADSFNHRIRKVATNGIITTFAGNGLPGYSGDGGPATSAQINNVNGVALDAVGNLYIADYGNYRIRKVATNGIITTIAGNGSPGYSGDRGPAAGAQLSTIWGMAVDAGGNLYMADYGNHRIRKIAANGIITTVAGNGFYGYAGDGGPAASAQIAYPSGVAVDGAGNLYLVDGDNFLIRKVTTDGIITTIAGNRYEGYSGDGGPATSAELGTPWGVVLDATGNVYIADSNNNAIRLLKPSAALLSVSASVNAASNLPGPVAPGEIVVLYGSRIGPAQLTQARADDQGRYPTNLAGARVLFNGTPAPMLYTSSTQASAIVPYSLFGFTASVWIEYQGAKSDPITVPIAPSAPALFTSDSSGKGQAAALNEDGSLNSVSRPAKAGTIVVFYATGEGQTSPAGVDGQPATTTLPKPMLRVDVTIDGKPAEVLYAGAAPGIVAGVMQINARIPINSQAGTVPVVLTVGSAASQPGVTIAVSGN